MGGEKPKSVLQARNKSPLEIEPKGKRRGAPPGPASGEAARSTYSTAAPLRLGSRPRPARWSPPRALEGGGGRRRHNRKFMAWVTCFPLPQWGPVTLNRKLMREERNLIFPPRLAGRGLGDRRQSGRHKLVRSEPRARCFLPNSGSWTAGWGGTATQAPSPTLRSPQTLQHFGRNLCSVTHALPGGAGPSTAVSPAPRARDPHGDSDVPLAPARLPNSGGPSSAQSSPAPTAWSRRRDRTGRHELPSPHPRASANREQVTTRAASGVAALRRFAGRERPLFSARGAAPPGRARRLLAPTPSRRALKGATRPTGLYPCRGEGHAGGWQRSKRSAFPPPLGQNSVAASPCPGLWSGGGPGPAATRHSLPETSRLEQDTLWWHSWGLGPGFQQVEVRGCFSERNE